MSVQIHVALWQPEEFKRGNGEFELSLDVALQLNVVDIVLDEVPTWLLQLESVQPFFEVLFDHEFFCVRFRLSLFLLCLLFNFVLLLLR